MMGSAKTGRRGSPLVVLGIVMVAWIGARAAVWENPFAGLPVELSDLLAEEDTAATIPGAPAPERSTDKLKIDSSGMDAQTSLANLRQLALLAPSIGERAATGGVPQFASVSSYSMEPRIAAGHLMLWGAALGRTSFGARMNSALLQPPGKLPPFSPAMVPASGSRTELDRWSLDAWAFWRQGSNATAISQGRVPIYGASQVGANLQYRLAPGSGRDPRLYARAYRALVSNGETEFAAGFAGRPIGHVPLRVQAELRVTDNAFQRELRRAAFVVTEFAPQRLPAGLVAEVYAQGGYVGGDNATAFVDGQVAVTREVARFDLADSQPARLSIGAGAWGGAQEDATRVDLGPSVRIDLTIGKVPARLSVDWREQVAGDAAPDSGIAATLSTRF